MKLALSLVTLLSIIGSASCVTPDASEGVTEKTVALQPVNYGSGVYYFPVTESNFGYSLSVFLREHGDSLEVAAMTGEGAKGYTDGYFVIFRNK